MSSATPDGEFDVVVAGLGAMGSAAVYQLARRGKRVLGIDQFTPAHAFGSSHGSTRIIRKAYFERPEYVPLLVRSYELWDQLSAEFGEQLITRCGALMIGRPDSPVIAGSVESARRWSLPHEVLESAPMRSRFPQFALSDDEIAVFEADAGFVRAEASILANLELALDAGAELWFDTEVEAVELGPGGVYLSTGETEVVAPRAVLATGAWAPRLANLHQFPITVQRQTMHWFEPVSSVADFTADRFPVYVWDRPVPPGGKPAELYGFPYLPGDVGVKAGLYHDGDGSDIEPDALDRVVTEADAARLVDQLETALPTLGGKWVSGAACMYPGVPDDDFVLGVHPGSSGRIVLAIGFSGHGFKFHPVVGEIVADLVTDGTTGHDIEFLSPNRLPRTT